MRFVVIIHILNARQHLNLSGTGEIEASELYILGMQGSGLILPDMNKGAEIITRAWEPSAPKAVEPQPLPWGPSHFHGAPAPAVGPQPLLWAAAPAMEPRPCHGAPAPAVDSSPCRGAPAPAVGSSLQGPSLACVLTAISGSERYDGPLASRACYRTLDALMFTQGCLLVCPTLEPSPALPLVLQALPPPPSHLPPSPPGAWGP